MFILMFIFIMFIFNYVYSHVYFMRISVTMGNPVVTIAGDKANFEDFICVICHDTNLKTVSTEINL